jgi:hypothetical protein
MTLLEFYYYELKPFGLIYFLIGISIFICLIMIKGVLLK